MNKNNAMDLIAKYKKEIEKETEVLDEEISAFNRIVIRDFIEWLYEAENCFITYRSLLKFRK